MSDVKRYEPFGRDGLSSVMHEDDVGDYVRHDDYEAKRKGWIDQHSRDSAELRRLCGERDSLFAERRQLESELRHRQKLIDDAWHAWEVALKGCEAMRSERDSHQRLCIAEMEKNSQLRAELEAIRGQQPDAVSVPRELLDKLLNAEAEHLHGQFEEALESLRALSTKNAEEGE